jgi:hypothetical protein
MRIGTRILRIFTNDLHESQKKELFAYDFGKMVLFFVIHANDS